MPARQHDRSLSVVLIVKDEEDVLEPALASVAWADEVVVYDTGSTDRTPEIARRFTEHVVEGYWDGDFGAARNRALAHATGTWVLSLDADEVLEADERQLRARLGEGGATVHSVIQVSGRATPRAPALEIPAHRVFRRGMFRWSGALHEQLVALPGAGLRIRPLPGVRLHHSGYSEDRMRGKDKSARNIAAAELELARLAEAPNSAPAEVAVAEANLARSYLMAGERYAEARDLARRVLVEGHMPVPTRATLARSMAVAAHDAGEHEEAERWLGVWEEIAGNVAWVWALRAQLAAQRDDPAATLDALERVPTLAVDGEQQRIARADFVQLEIWALARLGKHRRAAAVAATAARAGVQAASPAGLHAALGADGVDRVLPSVRDDDWTDLALQCGADGSRDARAFLERMHAAHPDRPAAMVVAARLHRVMSLEESARWAAELRRAGLDDLCPLVALAGDADVAPGARALAGALALSAYQDDRALPGLEDALRLVPADEEQELLAQLQVLAPGLIGVGA
ncbi:glycosyltransferase family 2 protein [Cellulomonas hominis]|uniref:glycosyltransferase family 2 protein n=1 Tax=Cellulomonas hominis TaxID=156981 RepID=UPI001444006C|nr:glycosyltransferase family 2 protein [Cellulomonas hominis]NKY10939.1 glycosyltransferase family 2 protein [Cellulomonas hominis]